MLQLLLRLIHRKRFNRLVDRLMAERAATGCVQWHRNEVPPGYLGIDVHLAIDKRLGYPKCYTAE